jgi:hypothetical protein
MGAACFICHLLWQRSEWASLMVKVRLALLSSVLYLPAFWMNFTV